MATQDEWERMAKRLLAKATRLFEVADPEPTEFGQRDPTIIALALLARTIGAAEAIFLLVDGDYVVESRTLTRSVLENLMFAAALANKGTAFVDELLDDDVHNRQVRAKALADFFRRVADPFNKKADLEAFRQALIEEHGRPDGIRMIKAAEAGGVADAYIAYRELSTDAAHPSATSISRHIIVPDDHDVPFVLSGHPVIDDTEAADTLGLLAMGLMGLTVAVNQILGGVDAGEPLEDLYRDYKALDRTHGAPARSAEGRADGSDEAPPKA